MTNLFTHGEPPLHHRCRSCDASTQKIQEKDRIIAEKDRIIAAQDQRILRIQQDNVAQGERIQQNNAATVERLMDCIKSLELSVRSLTGRQP